jgi:hypothetical protein
VGKQIILTGIFSFGPGYIFDLIYKSIKLKLLKWWSKKAKIQKLMNDIIKG